MPRLIYRVEGGVELARLMAINLGKNIRKYRLQANKTQGDISRKLGVGDAFMSRLEAGAVNMTTSSLAVLANELGVEMWQLFLPNKD